MNQKWHCRWHCGTSFCILKIRIEYLDFTSWNALNNHRLCLFQSSSSAILIPILKVENLDFFWILCLLRCLLCVLDTVFENHRKSIRTKDYSKCQKWSLLTSLFEDRILLLNSVTRQKLVENFKWDILSNFQTMCLDSKIQVGTRHHHHFWHQIRLIGDPSLVPQQLYQVGHWTMREILDHNEEYFPESDWKRIQI